MDFSVSDVEEIEKLASMNYTAREIAMVFEVKASVFIGYCLDEFHVVGKAYQKGQLVINRKKNKKLLKSIKGGSETAIQIHDKKSKDQFFLDVKNDMFSNFDE